MNARLDTLFTKLYHMNVRVGHIARWQATIGGFAPEATLSPPPPMASDSEDDDDSDDDNASDDDDEDASSTDEMSTWHFYPLSLMTKRGSSFCWIWK